MRRIALVWQCFRENCTANMVSQSVPLLFESCIHAFFYRCRFKNETRPLLWCHNYATPNLHEQCRWCWRIILTWWHLLKFHKLLMQRFLLLQHGSQSWLTFMCHKCEFPVWKPQAFTPLSGVKHVWALAARRKVSLMLKAFIMLIVREHSVGLKWVSGWCF